MAIMQEFEYFKPDSLESALELKAKYGIDGMPLAGGTDLVTNLNDDVISPKAIIDIKGLEELKKVELKDNKFFIGALTTFSDILGSEEIKKNLPLLWESACTVASVAIRNRATMTGNICSCVPCMDSATSIINYDADVVVNSNDGERIISGTDWFMGPRKTSIKPNEIVKGITFNIPDKKNGTCYLKLKRYIGEDLAQVALGILILEGNQYRISYGSVGPVPIRALKIEELLNGKELSDELIEKAKKLVPEEISPITDVRATKEFRTHMSQIMLERGLQGALSRLNNDGPKLGTLLI